MPQLQFHESGRALFVQFLRPGRTVVGRADTCDVALPSESVSRVHCVIEGRGGTWTVHDRSRHGTTVNGRKVPDGHALVDGDEISVGTYRAKFGAHGDPALRSPTMTMPVQAAIHEELVEVSESGMATAKAELKIVRGPRDGEGKVLNQLRTSVGGPGAMIELDPKLPSGAVYVRVVRGRAMVEPGACPAFLAGARVREITPIWAGEEVRVGDHGFVVDLTTVEDRVREAESFGDMVGNTPVMRRLFAMLFRMASHDAPVLITGESGTGKELAASGLHLAGPRFESRFVAVNCAAIADNLVESELFGHEKGAFTGATQRQDGAFHHADGGTLFLDEIGEMRVDLQAKLLRALESGEVRRVGGAAPEFPDVRVIAATNRNLPEMVRQGTFREDLYFRLAVLTVRMPSLRERRPDIPLVATALLNRNHPGARMTADAEEALKGYDWPGNVRELRNVLTRAFVLGGQQITAGNLAFHPWSFDGSPAPSRAPSPPAGELPPLPAGGVRPVLPPKPGSLGMADPERAALVTALEQAGGNRTTAARILGIPRSSLLYKLNKYGLMR